MEKEEKKPQFESVDIDGVEYKTLLTNKFKQRKKYEEPNPAVVSAFIPGKIAEIFVKKNKKVKEGDLVLTLEAMKMLNKVIAPMDGEIVLHVEEEDIVSKNQLLFKVIT